MGLVGWSSSQADSLGSVNPDYNLEEDPLVTENDMAEVEGFLEAYPELTKDYIPIAVIGEGRPRPACAEADGAAPSRDL